MLLILEVVNIIFLLAVSTIKDKAMNCEKFIQVATSVRDET